MEKQYLVLKPYENITPSAEICLESELVETVKMLKGRGTRIFEWDLNKLGLDEVEVVTEIRKKKVEDTFTRPEDEENSDPDRTKYPK